MRKFLISAGQVEMGVYDGVTERDAIDAYVSDAGYLSVADAADACGQSEEQFLADIRIEELEASPS